MIPDTILFVYLIKWMYIREEIPKQVHEPRIFSFYMSAEDTKLKNNILSSLEKKILII